VFVEVFTVSVAECQPGAAFASALTVTAHVAFFAMVRAAQVSAVIDISLFADSVEVPKALEAPVRLAMVTVDGAPTAVVILSARLTHGS
jgi:hypothetical protein